MHLAVVWDLEDSNLCDPNEWQYISFIIRSKMVRREKK